VEGFFNVGPMDDLGERRAKNIPLADGDVVVVRVANTVHAFENNCPHQHFSLLHQGFIDRCSITCPMHGWTFDLASGTSTNGSGSLKKRMVKVVEGRVWIQAKQADRGFALFDAT